MLVLSRTSEVFVTAALAAVMAARVTVLAAGSERAAAAVAVESWKKNYQ